MPSFCRVSPLKFSFLLVAFLVAPAGQSHALDLEHISKGTNPFMSSEGRFVAFIGSNLVSASDGVNQVYLYDRDNDSIELVSQGVSGVGDDPTFNLPKWVGQRAVSDDGRYVVFQTTASDLSPPGPELRHVHVRDMETGTTTLVSKSTAGDAANFTNESGEFSIAPDGWGILFNSTASNLDAADTDNFTNTFLYQLSDNSTKLACFDRDGDKLNDCKKVSLSCTGSMAFVSASSTVVPAADDLHPGNDVFTGIPLNGTNTIISVGPSGQPADSLFFSAPSISCDGNRIAFGTKASLTLADTDAGWDLYVHDTSTGIAALIRGPSDTPLGSSEVTMSPGGTWIAFETAEQLVGIDDFGAVTDTYIVFYSRDRVDLGAPKLVSQDNGDAGNAASVSPTVGNNGGVGFQSASGNFDPVDSNTDVFVNFDGCSPIRLELNDSLVSDMQTKEACEIFSKTTTVEPTGNLTLKAHRIALGPDFTVDAGAILTLGDL